MVLSRHLNLPLSSRRLRTPPNTTGTGLSKSSRTSELDFRNQDKSTELVHRDPKHVEWVRAYLALLEELRKYIMEFHTTGLFWSPTVCLEVVA